MSTAAADDCIHISHPEATVMEIAEEVSRAVRCIRHHAREYGVDPRRLGLTGGSAGGHLSLLLATRGGPGPADATLKSSSAFLTHSRVAGFIEHLAFV
jgi:acetyl esterase/lipase